MTGNFKQLGAAVAALFEQKTEEQIAADARTERLPEILKARSIITPEMIRRIAADELPECFVVDRASYVAIAQIAYQALQLVDATVATLATPTSGPQH